MERWTVEEVAIGHQVKSEPLETVKGDLSLLTGFIICRLTPRVPAGMRVEPRACLPASRRTRQSR